MENKNPGQDVRMAVDYSEYESVSHAIIDSIATIKEKEPTELEPLYHSIDLEAVDRLFETSPHDDLEIEQRIDYYVLTIRGNGELEISE